MKLTPLQNAITKVKDALRGDKYAKWFELYHNHARGTGNTTSLIAGCKARNSTLICHEAGYAEKIREEHKIKVSHLLSERMAHAPAESVVDNAAIYELAKEHNRLVALTEELMQILDRKGIW